MHSTAAMAASVAAQLEDPRLFRNPVTSTDLNWEI